MSVGSLYLRILLASLLTAIVTLAVFMAIAGQVMRRITLPLFTGAYALQLEQAVDVNRESGSTALAAYLTRLDVALNAEHHLVDTHGRDLVSGADLSAMMPTGPQGQDAPQRIGERLVFARTSGDGRHTLLIFFVPRFTLATFAPFYLLVLVAVIFLSWLVAVGIVSPLRTLTTAVDKFGHGDLSARVPVHGKNEIARLGSSFNHMADRLQALLTAERQLLQDVSHELRSPLARLSFAIELGRTSPNREAAADRAQKQVERLTSLVRELVEMTRAEGDPATRASDEVGLGSLVREIANVCAVDAEVRHCQVSVHGDSARTIRGDRVLLARAFENVLQNAIRFSPEAGTVDVTIEEHPAETAIVVRDRGPGVPDDALPNLFDAFYRVDQSREAATGGLGLGLAIASRAVHLHHGSIRAENDKPGLRVTITLPHADRDSRSHTL